MSNSHDSNYHRFAAAAEKALENGNEERAGELALLADLTKDNRQGEDSYSPKMANGNFSGVVMSSIQKIPIDWIWQNWLPVGCVSFLIGDGGAGKSTFRDDIVARVTTGRDMPDGTPCLTAGVVFISYEENIEGLVVDRLEKAGADTNRIIVLNEVVREDESDSTFKLPEDIKTLEDIVATNDIALVVIDPWKSALSDRVPETNRSVRSVINKLQKMAYRQGIAILIVGHYTKSSSGDRIKKTGGSEGMTSIARSLLYLDKDPTNPNVRILTLEKHSNTTAKPAQIAIKMEKNGHLEYLTGISVQKEEVLKAKRLSQSRQDVLTLLRSEPDRQFSPREVCQLTAFEYPYIRQLLMRMTDSNEIVQPARGLYQAIPLQDMTTQRIA